MAGGRAAKWLTAADGLRKPPAWQRRMSSAARPSGRRRSPFFCPAAGRPLPAAYPMKRTNGRRWMAAAFSDGVRRVSFVLLFAFLSAAVIRTTLLLDINKEVFDHKPGRCRPFAELADGGAAYFEDVPALRFLFASDGFRKLAQSGHNSSIFFLQYPPKSPPKNAGKSAAPSASKSTAFSRAEEKLEFKRLSIRAEKLSLEDFTPLGIGSHVEGPATQGRYRLHLYVVNAPAGRSPTVEVFLFKPEQSALLHQHTVRDAAFGSLSDIVVLGAGRFVVSSMFHSTSWIGRVLEAYTQREYGSLLMHDGKKATRLVGGLQTPNGLFWDPKKRHLYVSLTFAEAVKIFHLQPDFEISELTALNLMTSARPAQVERSGRVPIAHSFLRVLFGHQTASPSQILRVRFQGEMSSWVITEPFANNGTSLPAASGLTIVDDLLLIGGRSGKGLLCKINDLTYA
ncbi:hypothetical protein M3Y99_00353000 [Aphelenchoides fujianensis]|nr:hypothetical protein M3Y99_00353000 [Aphelenchoides fujianensis]